MASLGNSETLSRSKKKKVRRGGSEPIIPATWEMEKGGFWFKSSLGKKLARLAFKKQALIPVMGKHKLGGSWSRLTRAKVPDLSEKELKQEGPATWL
jgi:hypothetical protein